MTCFSIETICDKSPADAINLVPTNLILSNPIRIYTEEAYIYANERDATMPMMFDFMETFGPLLGVAGTIFWIWMLIDCLNRAKARPQRGWLFVLIFFTHWVGALVYFFIYVYPLNKLFQSTPPPSQSTEKKPFIYYTPPRPPAQTPPSYQEYQQGYQPRSVPMPAPTSTSTPYYSQEDAQQTTYPTPDYEEPHATYPEMPPQQQQ